MRTLRKLGPIVEGSADYGDFFEHLVYHHLRAYIAYKNRESTLHFWRSTSQFEVDFVLDGRIAIDCKATRNPQDKHLRGLQVLKEEGGIEKQILVCLVDRPLIREGVEILPLAEFLQRLWNGVLEVPLNSMHP